jgi:alpha-L-fucosidase
LYGKDEPWRDAAVQARSTPGEFSAQIDALTRGAEYEFRALVKHPLLTVFGEEKLIGR